MYHLVIAVISIALLGSMATLAVSNAPVAAFKRDKDMRMLVKAMHEWDRVTTRYLADRRQWQVIDTVIMGEDEIDIWGPDFPGNGFTVPLTAAHGFTPALPQGYSVSGITYFTHPNAGPAVTVCLQGPADAEPRDAIYMRVKTEFSLEAISVGTSCEATTFTAPASGRYLVFWKPLAHY